MELLIVMVILGLLAAIVGPALWHTDGVDRREAVAATLISHIEVALDSYHLDTFKYPNTLEGLIKNTSNNPKWQGPYLRKGLPKDPWGNEYQYQKPGQQGRDYDLFSFGADGQKGGTDENADVVNWQTKQTI